MQLTDLTTQNIMASNEKSVIVLQAKKYSPLFLRRVINSIAQTKSLAVQKIDLDLEISEIQKILQTTFLGQRFIYWFSDVSSITSKKKRADWIAYLAEYQGPHVLIGCSGEDMPAIISHGMVIEVQDWYTSDQVVKLAFLYETEKLEQTAYFIGKLYRYRKQYSVEQLCMLLEYANVLGKNTDSFFETWLDQLVVSDVSLYWLSQIFFEKKADKFFEVWEVVRPLYSDQFWTSFFSEQLFRAYIVVSLQGRITAEHKMITMGLPFSFLKTDWRMYQTSFLQKAHQYIYQVDLSLKSGGSVRRLDLFFVQFFRGFGVKTI